MFRPHFTIRRGPLISQCSGWLPLLKRPRFLRNTVEVAAAAVTAAAEPAEPVAVGPAEVEPAEAANPEEAGLLAAGQPAAEPPVAEPAAERLEQCRTTTFTALTTNPGRSFRHF